MGPIERELRQLCVGYVDIWRASDEAFGVAFGAAESLGFSRIADADNCRALPDVLSEAIEAAEALGL